MLYFGNPSTGPIAEAMSAGLFGCIITPKQGLAIPDGAWWGADNGKFGKGYPGDEQFVRWLDGYSDLAATCWFAIAPDVPFDASGTLELSPRFFAAIRGMGLPVGLAAQNGMEYMSLPWDEFDVLCLGGDYAWKRGIGAARLAGEAIGRGKHVHWLRANSHRALAHAAGIGCRSADGTFFIRAPDKNLGRALQWYGKLDRRGVQRFLV